MASLVHHGGRLLAAVVLGIGVPPDGLSLLSGNVQQLVKGAFLILRQAALSSTCEVNTASVSQVTCVLMSVGFKNRAWGILRLNECTFSEPFLGEWVIREFLFLVYYETSKTTCSVACSK